MDEIFSERPGLENDWEKFMSSDANDEVEGFVFSEEYVLDNAYAIRGVMTSRYEDQIRLYEEICKAE